MQSPKVVKLIDVVGALLRVRAALQFDNGGKDVDARERGTMQLDNTLISTHDTRVRGG
jgi:hypothetical protein